jgi:hypothetical protein
LIERNNPRPICFTEAIKKISAADNYDLKIESASTFESASTYTLQELHSIEKV